MNNKQKAAVRMAAMLAAIVFCVFGMSRGEMAVVLDKAVHICLECIGLG